MVKLINFHVISLLVICSKVLIIVICSEDVALICIIYVPNNIIGVKIF